MFAFLYLINLLFISPIMWGLYLLAQTMATKSLAKNMWLAISSTSFYLLIFISILNPIHIYEMMVFFVISLVLWAQPIIFIALKKKIDYSITTEKFLSKRKPALFIINIIIFLLMLITNQAILLYLVGFDFNSEFDPDDYALDIPADPNDISNSWILFIQIVSALSAILGTKLIYQYLTIKLLDKQERL